MTLKQEQIFFEIHRDNPREGPGNFESTRRAYAALGKLSEKLRILDIGCGPGKQTLDLARISSAEIYALDNYEIYVNRLKQIVREKNLGNRIFPFVADMSSLNFEEAYFDIIWAEGSIYIIGFDRGLRLWKPLLKPRGYLAATEISWLKDNPPPEVRQFWENGYPAMKTIKGNLEIIRKADYKLVEHFTLPESAWWDYYLPIEKKIERMKNRYQNDPAALEVLEIEAQEIELYRKYSEYYGYVFYVMQTNEINP